MSRVNVGFIGAGGIARAHAFSLGALKFYYDDVLKLELKSVTSSRPESRINFAKKYGFRAAQTTDEFYENEELNTVFILGPNKVHYEHLKLALEMPNVSRIYLEKPVCSTENEEDLIRSLVGGLGRDVKIQVGFQFVQNAAVREAIGFWKSGMLGKPIHFEVKYYHGDYLKKSYRDRRQTRLTPAPDGGAMADLGSHAISLIMAFLGNDLKIVNAIQSGDFEDVNVGSDLFSCLTLKDEESKAVGTLAASRVSSGTGDLLSIEIFAENGAIRFNSHQQDYFEFFLEETGTWSQVPVGSNYKPVTSFPSGHVPAGWLRSMMHAHYLFLGGEDDKAFFPNINHGLEVQRVVRETADFLNQFRKMR